MDDSVYPRCYGTSIGLQAAIVPLTVSAAPFIAYGRERLLEIPTGLIELPAQWDANTDRP